MKPDPGARVTPKSLANWVGAADGAPLPADQRCDALEIYRLYVEMADKVTERRQSANNFFLGISTAALGVLGYLRKEGSVGFPPGLLATLAIAGAVLCFLWYRQIRSYRDLNSAKFRVVHEIEATLALRPYFAEWEAVGRGKNRKLYLPSTQIEMAVPWLFLALFLFALAFAVLS